jgi:hypothetical protein
MSQQYVVRTCTDCQGEDRPDPCPLCHGEGRVAITPYPAWMGGQYPYNVFPEDAPDEVDRCRRQTTRC